ncbi:hypothetical protein GRB29_01695 [Streptococcus pneumoniae]|nr:hypothetical protein [Streptococcus pneumoniae]
MTSHGMKQNLFKEKMTKVLIGFGQSGTFLETASTVDRIPGGITLTASVDFFNIFPNKEYTLIANLIKQNKDETFETHPLKILRTVFSDENVHYHSFDGSGKANGTFNFDFNYTESGDYLVYLQFTDSSGKELDSFYQYFCFVQE